MFLIEFECLSSELKSQVKRKSGFFKKSDETTQSLAIKYFQDCREFCEGHFPSKRTYFLAHSELPVDECVKSNIFQQFNLIPYRDGNSIMDVRITEDWLQKNAGDTKSNARFLCLVESKKCSYEVLIEPVIADAKQFMGKVTVFEKSSDRIKVSRVTYPDGRLDGAVVGDPMFDCPITIEDKNLFEELSDIGFFDKSETNHIQKIPVESNKGAEESPKKSEAKEQRKMTTPTEFDVILSQGAKSTVDTIKVLRAVLNLGLREAKQIADNIPTVIEEYASTTRANNLKTELESGGVTVTLKPRGSSGTTSQSPSNRVSINMDDVAILICDLEDYADRNGMDGKSEADVANAAISNIGLEVVNSLSCQSKPQVAVYSGDSEISFIDYDDIKDEQIASAIDVGSINLVVNGLSAQDWESKLVYMTGDANTRILVVGMHPSFDEPVRQVYDCGDLDTGIVEDPDTDMYMNDDVRNLFNSVLRI